MLLSNILCFGLYVPGILFNCLFLVSIKTPRSPLNPTDFTLLIKTVHYIIAFAFLVIADTRLGLENVFGENGEKITSEFSEMLLDTLPSSSLILAVVRISVFNQSGNSIRKVQRSTVLTLYGSCTLFAFLCSQITHVPYLLFELKQTTLNSSRCNQPFRYFELTTKGLNYFVVYIAPFVASGIIYLFIVLKTGNSASRISKHAQRSSTDAPAKDKALKSVRLSIIRYVAIFLFLWTPVISLALCKRISEKSYDVGPIAICIKGMILLSQPIGDGMFQVSRRKSLISNITKIWRRKNSNAVVAEDREQTSGRTSIELESSSPLRHQRRTSLTDSRRPSRLSLYSRRRNSGSQRPVIRLSNTPIQVVMVDSPTVDNIQVSSIGTFSELLSPIFYQRDYDEIYTPAIGFRSSQSGECFVESISFRSSTLSVDQTAYSGTPTPIYTHQSNRRMSFIRSSRSASTGASRLMSHAESSNLTAASTFRCRTDTFPVNRSRFPLHI